MELRIWIRFRGIGFITRTVGNHNNSKDDAVVIGYIFLLRPFVSLCLCGCCDVLHTLIRTRSHRVVKRTTAAPSLLSHMRVLVDDDPENNMVRHEMYPPTM